MRNKIISSFSAVAAVAIAAGVQADVCTFTYTGSASNPTVVASGTVNLTGTNAITGSITLSGDGAMNGVYTLITGGAGVVHVPGWDITYDQILDCAASPPISNGGLAFENGSGDYVNIYSNSPTSFSIAVWSNTLLNWAPADDGGSFTCDCSVPVPGAAALVGLAGMISSRRRRL